ncbi:MAG: glycerol-3-phosphate O-acyltransferase [Saprospiraceae bacterium]|jgi:glycerol-3-phosphate O-acyltransferase
MKEFPHIIKELKDWPISRFYANREGVVRKLAEKAKKRIQKDEKKELLNVLGETIYAEKLRSKSNPLKVDPPKEYSYWKNLESKLSTGVRVDKDAERIHDELLQKIVNRYSEEIVGDFNGKTFKFAIKVLTILFKILFSPFYSKIHGLFWGNRETLLDRFDIVGPLDHIRELFDKGTVMVLPTHSSNLDSILLGYVMEMKTGLPFFSYGAGLNLFDYEILAYYMSRLGPYKIDRRKKNPIYSPTLREYSSLSIEEGLNSIFFPGGTRSRSGELENVDTMKLGLMNTLIDSQNEFYMQEDEKKLIVIPLVISYQSVLEGSSLIDQHLKRTGKSNYLTGKSGKKKSFRTLRFLSKLFKNGSTATFSFGHPMDVFGNPLDKEGRSIKNGKVIDIRGYFQSEDRIVKDTQRNRVYSRHLSAALSESYKRENVVLTSNIVSFTAFEVFKNKHPHLDLYSLLTLPSEYFDFPVDKLCKQVGNVRTTLVAMELNGEIRLSEMVRSRTAEEIVKDGIHQLKGYHSRLPLLQKNEIITCEDLKLLFYYHNRLNGYDLEGLVEVTERSGLKLAKSLY